MSNHPRRAPEDRERNGADILFGYEVLTGGVCGGFLVGLRDGPVNEQRRLIPIQQGEAN
jgi:nitrogenase subunit NifH